MAVSFGIPASAVVVGAILVTIPNDVNSLSSGAPGGHTGSPANASTCVAACHSANPGNGNLNEVSTITHDVPVTGYEPDSTYNFSLNMDGVGTNRFGFSLSPQNSNGDVLGTLIAGANNYTVGGGNYLTHTYASTNATDSQVWDFQWTAPQSGTGMVTFYAATLYANNNNNHEGDYEVLAESAVMEELNVGVLLDKDFQFSIYPNPAVDVIRLNADLDDQTAFKIIDLKGATVQEGMIDAGMNPAIQLDRSNVISGMHILRLSSDQGSNSTRILIQ